MTHLLWLMSGCIALGLAVGITPAAQAQPRAPVVTAVNAFGVDLYGLLGRRDGDLFFSPLNIATAFSMAASGARGETAGQMRKVLHQAGDARAVDAAMGGLAREMAARDGVQLHAANALWIDKGFVLDDAYRHAMAEAYDSGVHTADFGGDPSGARATINQWVADRTADRIRDLLAEPPAGPMVITSALYLKADWVKPFAAEATTDGDFHLSGAGVAPSRLMNALTPLRYLDGGQFQAVAAPYRGDLSLVVFLPKRVDGLATFERGMTAGKLETWLSALDRQTAREVRLTLPKYRLEDSFTLAKPLKALGMGLAFADAADFSGIDGKRDLRIEDAVHKTFLAVDEAGTEAAAVTAILMVTTSARGPSRAPIVFRADHPFFFLIRDDRSGAILFMGRLMKPTH